MQIRLIREITIPKEITQTLYYCIIQLLRNACLLRNFRVLLAKRGQLSLLLIRESMKDEVMRGRTTGNLVHFKTQYIITVQNSFSNVLPGDFILHM